MAFSFPSNPTVGQQVTGPNGFTYQFDGKGWVTLGGGDFLPLAGGTLTGPLELADNATQPLEPVPLRQLEASQNIHSGTTAPSNPANGDLWFDTNESGGGLKSWNGNAWVASNATVSGFLPLTGGTVTGFVGITRDLVVGGRLFVGDRVIGNPFIAGNVGVMSVVFRDIYNASSQNYYLQAGSGYLLCYSFVAGGVVLQVNPDGGCYNISGSWIALSDPRIKTDVAAYDHGLSQILALEPITYRFNGKGGAPHDAESVTRVGLDAASARNVLPEAVSSRPGEIDGETTDVLSLDSGPLVYALVNAVKELSARLEALESAR